MDERSQIFFGETAYPVVRYKLRDWLRLDTCRSKILKAAESRNKDEMETSIYSYLSAALGLTVDQLHEVDWWELTQAFAAIMSANIPNQSLPILSINSQDDKDETPVWDYDGRSWYLWAHIFAKEYGWSLDYISNLDVDDAFALSQEIVVDQQVEREWNWSMSEVAYSYDESSKTSKLIKLPRPAWMQYKTKESPETKKIKIPIAMLPIGVVISYDKKSA